MDSKYVGEFKDGMITMGKVLLPMQMEARYVGEFKLSKFTWTRHLHLSPGRQIRR